MPLHQDPSSTKKCAIITPTKKQIKRSPYQPAELLSKPVFTQEKRALPQNAPTVKQSIKYGEQPRLYWSNVRK